MRYSEIRVLFPCLSTIPTSTRLKYHTYCNSEDEQNYCNFHTNFQFGFEAFTFWLDEFTNKWSSQQPITLLKNTPNDEISFFIEENEFSSLLTLIELRQLYGDCTFFGREKSMAKHQEVYTREIRFKEIRKLVSYELFRAASPNKWRTGPLEIFMNIFGGKPTSDTDEIKRFFLYPKK